jgi:hypothetical protein
MTQHASPKSAIRIPLKSNEEAKHTPSFEKNVFISSVISRNELKVRLGPRLKVFIVNRITSVLMSAVMRLESKWKPFITKLTCPHTPNNLIIWNVL